MVIFLLTFLFLYGGIHFYAFHRANSIFHFSAGLEISIAVLFLILIFAPLLVRILEGWHLESLARAFAYIGYLWMAFIFLFFCLSVTFDALRLTVKFFPAGVAAVPLINIMFGLAVFFSFAIVVYGYFDAQIIRTKKLEISTGHKLSPAGKIRIAQISDLHVGLIIREKRLQAVLDKVKEADPDILISTGDLLDGELNNIMSLADLFSQIKPKYGKYAITGNHEYFAGIEQSLAFTRRAGFDILRDEVRQVAGITIVGIDDLTGRQKVPVTNNPQLAASLAKIHRDQFVLQLKHQPNVYDQEKFNLQLSGHTHRGQIFPFRLVTGLFFSHNYGYYELRQNKLLYVSGGAGTWGPPVRVFAPPEITVIDLIGKISNQ